MKKEYFIKFTCGYGILVFAQCLEDAIVLAKANAIYKGYSRPLLKSIKFPDGETVMRGHSVNSFEVAIPEHNPCDLF